MSGAGDLRERVTIEARSRVSDGAGGEVVTWAALATVWANVQALSGAEVTLAERIEARLPYNVTIRFRDDLRADMRLIRRGEVLNIRNLRDTDGRRRWLEIRAEGGVA